MKIVVIFLLLVSSVSSQQFQTNMSSMDTSQPQQPGLPYSVGDVRNCAQSGASPLRVLKALPGIGFDNLRNFDMIRVRYLNYSSCKTTANGRHLLPDGYFVIPRHGTDLTYFSEFVGNWYDYKSVTSASINLEGSLGLKLFSIGGSLSAEKRRVKTQMGLLQSLTSNFAEWFIL